MLRFKQYAYERAANPDILSSLCIMCATRRLSCEHLSGSWTELGPLRQTEIAKRRRTDAESRLVQTSCFVAEQFCVWCFLVVCQGV